MAKFGPVKLACLVFQNIRITYMLKVLRVANSDKNTKYFSNYIHIIKSSVSNCVTHLGYINAGKSRILGIFPANCGFLLHFGGIIPKTRDIH